MTTPDVLDDFLLPDFCSKAGAWRLLGLSLLIALILMLAQAPVLWPFPVWDFTVLFLVTTGVIAITFGSVCRWRHRMSHWSHRRIGLFTVCFLAFNVLWVSLLGLFLIYTLHLPLLSFAVTEWQLIVRTLFIVVIFSSLFLRYLVLQSQLRRREQAALQTRLAALQARIQPHFLFNAMNIIASLIAVDPDKAEQVVENLATLFRASLKDSVDVPLREELDLCRRYAYIEQLRLGERLVIDWQLPDDTGDARIPLLTLQPLLENAIRHGVEQSAEPSLVSVQVSLTATRLNVTLSNPLPETPRQDGNQMAVVNIQERLRARYGSDAFFTAQVSAGRYTTYLGLSRTPPSRPRNAR